MPLPNSGVADYSKISNPSQYIVQSEIENRINNTIYNYTLANTLNFYEDYRARSHYTDVSSYTKNDTTNFSSTDIPYVDAVAINNRWNTGQIFLTTFPTLYNKNNITTGTFVFNLQQKLYPTARIYDKSLYSSSWTYAGTSIYDVTYNGGWIFTLKGSYSIPALRLRFISAGQLQKYDQLSNITNENTSYLPSELNPLSSNYLDTNRYGPSISILFREYIHYVSNPAGGTGLLDLTPYNINSMVYIERDSKIKNYSPYNANNLEIDFKNYNLDSLWPTISASSNL